MKKYPLQNLSFLSMLLAFFLGNCGVNSGNPTGNSITTASVYVETSKIASVQSLSLRVRGVQFINNDQMHKPDEAQTESIVFDSVKVIDLTDVSQGERIALLENRSITFRDYRQVRLLLDPTQAGTAVLSSGETKAVMAIPLDLFVVDQGSALPNGGRQTDQLAMVSSQSMMTAGGANKMALRMDWAQIMVAPQTLSSSLSEYFMKEKGLSQQDMNTMMFLQPMQAEKSSIVPIKN